MPTTTECERAAERGRYDASRDRAPIFRNVRGYPAEVDCHLADEWTHDMRAAYVAAYWEVAS